MWCGITVDTDKQITLCLVGNLCAAMQVVAAGCLHYLRRHQLFW